MGVHPMSSHEDADETATKQLRHRAETMWHSRHEDLTTKSPEEVLRLVEELQIHQIELQIQNRELLDTQTALEDSRQQFRDLYDFAPVGYLTVDVASLIAQANLTLAMMLGTSRRRLVGRHFNLYVDRTSQIDFYRALRSDDASWSGELVLRKLDGALFPVSVEMMRMGDDVVSWRCVVTDIAMRKV